LTSCVLEDQGVVCCVKRILPKDLIRAVGLYAGRLGDKSKTCGLVHFRLHRVGLRKRTGAVIVEREVAEFVQIFRRNARFIFSTVLLIAWLVAGLATVVI
jgi:hypothetical protein